MTTQQQLDGMPEPERLDLPGLCEAAAITARQADYWTRKGYLHAVDEDAPGSGHPRTWAPTEVHVAVLMHDLLRAGFHVGAAAELAREYVTREHGHRGAVGVLVAASRAWLRERGER